MKIEADLGSNMLFNQKMAMGSSSVICRLITQLCHELSLCFNLTQNLFFAEGLAAWIQNGTCASARSWAWPNGEY